MLFRAICLLSAFWSLTVPANAADPIVLHVNTFPTARSLPFYVAGEKGFFARHGLKVDLEFTQNSRNLRDGLASGKYDIVHSAADNAIDMIEVGESTGALPAMLNSVAEFFEEDVNTKMAATLSLIEPAIMIVMGGFVAFVLIALYLPIFSLADTIR